MQTAALWGVIGLGAWIAAAALLMLVSPARAIAMLRRTASSRTVNTVEQGLRLLAGAALAIRAPASEAPQLFEHAGYFVIASSILLLVLPLRWHSAYANWWADRLAPTAVRMLAPVSLTAGVAVAWAAI